MFTVVLTTCMRDCCTAHTAKLVIDVILHPSSLARPQLSAKTADLTDFGLEIEELPHRACVVYKIR